jgi:iron(III) transport system substrate-binding protein
MAGVTTMTTSRPPIAPFVLSLGLALVCVPSAVTTAASAESTDTAFEQEWEDLIAAAQEEGELVVVSGPDGVTQDGPFFDAFGEEFDIEVSQFGGAADEVVARVLAERDQGVYSYDVGATGTTGASGLLEAGAIAPFTEQLIHPEAIDRSEGWRLDYIPFADYDLDQNHVTFMAMTAEPNVMQLWYNTDNVSQEELDSLQSWYDLLDPAFRGRIAMGNVAEGQQSEDRAKAWHLLGEEFFERFMREMDVQVLPYGAGRDFADGLARGDFDFGLFPPEEPALIDAEDQGLPVTEFDRTFSEGTSQSPLSLLYVIDNAAHPNAAQLFANWVLTVEGQTAFNELTLRTGRAALRSDVPQGNIADETWERLNDPNAVFLDQNSDEYRAAVDESEQWFQEIFAELGITPGG